MIDAEIKYEYDAKTSSLAPTSAVSGDAFAAHKYYAKLHILPHSQHLPYPCSFHFATPCRIHQFHEVWPADTARKGRLYRQSSRKKSSSSQTRPHFACWKTLKLIPACQECKFNFINIRYCALNNGLLPWVEVNENKNHVRTQVE